MVKAGCRGMRVVSFYAYPLDGLLGSVDSFAPITARQPPPLKQRTESSHPFGT